MLACELRHHATTLPTRHRAASKGNVVENKIEGRQNSSGLAKSLTEQAGPDPCRAIGCERREFIEQTRIDAVAAHDCIVALMEMLYGCPPGHQISAGRLVALLALPQAYLANVVDGFSVEPVPG